MAAGSRILIVDDEPNLRETLADILRDEGYQVGTAADGQTAIEMCAADPYDVLLLDFRLPDLDGIETYREIRRLRQGIRAILISAYSGTEQKQQALDEGAVAFLSKPIDVDQLIRLIAQGKDTAALVVASDLPTIRLVAETLKDQGSRVTVAGSPAEAIRLCEQLHFDLVLIDVQLPGMTGLELYLHLRKIAPSIIAVMMADRDEALERIAQEAIRQTAYGVVSKPLDPNRLLALLHRVTGQYVSGILRKPEPEQP